MRIGSEGPWAVAAGAIGMFWPGVLSFGFPGVLGPYWRETFGVGQGATGSIMFFVLASLGVFMFLVGRWQERVGPRVMMTIGALLSGVGCLILAFADSIAMVYVWGFLNGAASCFVYMPALTIVQRWFPARRGLVSGVVNLVFGSSAAVMVPLLGGMLDTLGYRPMNLLIAALAAGTGLIAALAASDPFQLQGAAGPAAAGAAAPPPASGPSTARRPEPSAGPASVQAASLPPAPLTARDALASRNFWFIWLTWACMGSAGVSMVVLSVNFGVSRGLPLTSAAVILTAFNLTNGLSRIVTGYFSDRIRRNLTMSSTFVLAAVSYFLLPRAGSLAAAAILAAIIGFGFGTLFAVSAPLAVDCFGLKHFGSIFGLIFTAYGFIAGLLGPSLSGYLLDSSGLGYSGVFTYLGVLCLVAAVSITLVRPAPKAAVAVA